MAWLVCVILYTYQIAGFDNPHYHLLQLHGKGDHFTHISSSTGTQARFGVGVIPENCEAAAAYVNETESSIPAFNFSSVFYEGYNIWDNGVPSMDSFDSRHSSELYTIKALEYLNDAHQEEIPWFLYLSYQGETLIYDCQPCIVIILSAS